MHQQKQRIWRRFQNIHQYVKIICPTHGIFKQKPSKHQKGQGCKKCNKGEVWTTEDFTAVDAAIVAGKKIYS